MKFCHQTCGNIVVSSNNPHTIAFGIMKSQLIVFEIISWHRSVFWKICKPIHFGNIWNLNVSATSSFFCCSWYRTSCCCRCRFCCNHLIRMQQNPVFKKIMKIPYLPVILLLVDVAQFNWSDAWGVHWFETESK